MPPSHPHLEWAPERRVARGDGSVMSSAHVELVIVLEQQWPLGGVELGDGGLRLDEEVGRALRLGDGAWGINIGGIGLRRLLSGFLRLVLAHRADDTRC